MATMKALRAHARGGPEMLVYEDAPVPEPGPGQVRVRVSAAAITFAELDWDETWARGGVSRTPTIPSHEFVGTVDALGAGVTDLALGQRVFGLLPFDHDGAAAGFAVADSDILAAAPVTLDDVHVAAIPLAALTVWQAFVHHAPVNAGDEVLVHGGAGGVGVFAIQLAHRLGARVTTTARVDDEGTLRRLGADRVIDFRTARFDDAERYDVVLDTVGGEILNRSYPVVKPGGALITLQGPPDAGRVAQLGIRGIFFIVTPSRSDLEELAKLADAGALRALISATYPLADGRAAFASRSTPNRAPGKTVLTVTQAG